jgi:hypothetical protein
MATFSHKGKRIGARGKRFNIQGLSRCRRALFPLDQCLEKAGAKDLKSASFAKRLGKHVVRCAPWWKDAGEIEKGARP